MGKEFLLFHGVHFAPSSNTGFVHTDPDTETLTDTHIIHTHRQNHTRVNDLLPFALICCVDYTLMIYSSSFLFHWIVENNGLRICEVRWREDER